MNKLKIAFVIDDSGMIPAWYFATISEVIRSSFLDILFITEPAPVEQEYSLLYKVFQQFEMKWFRPEDNAATLIQIEKLPLENQLIITSNSLPTLQTQKPDVIYSIHHSPIPYQLYAKYGFWHISFGIDKYRDNNLPAFWEVMDNQQVTGSALLATIDAKTILVSEGSTRTIPFSVRNNFNVIAWKTSAYLLPALKALANQSLYFFDKREEAGQQAKKQLLPSNSAMLFLFARNNLRYLLYKLNSKRPQPRFKLLYANQPFALNTIAKTSFQEIAVPAEEFYADPFILQKEGINYIFFERFENKKDRAHIAVIEEHNGQFSKPRTVLEKQYHLSYPFVFEHEGSVYMIPETASNRTVELYKATRFPDHWEWQMNLMEDVVLFDATLHYANGNWWLFANSHTHPATSTNDQLYLFYSNELLSNTWTPHIQNPVANHAANCRPAGAIFQAHGKWYRPAQNNASQQYGYGLKINEIEILNEEEYREKEIADLHPEQFGLKACHQLSFSNNLIVIDGINY